jgi:hypothetical protein
MHRHECNIHNHFFNFRKSSKGFLLYYIYCKENKCWKGFKVMRKLLFSYSLYSHPEIGNSGCDSGGPWAADRPYIVRPQRRNGRPRLNVYPALMAIQRSAAPTDLLPRGSFWLNDYLAVAASSVRESACAGPQAMFRSTRTHCASLSAPNIKTPK